MNLYLEIARKLCAYPQDGPSGEHDHAACQDALHDAANEMTDTEIRRTLGLLNDARYALLATHTH